MTTCSVLGAETSHAPPPSLTYHQTQTLFNSCWLTVRRILKCFNKATIITIQVSHSSISKAFFCFIQMDLTNMSNMSKLFHIVDMGQMNIRVTWDMTHFLQWINGRFELWLVRNNTHLIKHSDHSPTGEGIKIGARTEELSPHRGHPSGLRSRLPTQPDSQ